MGPCGSVRALVVEFSYYTTVDHDVLIGHERKSHDLIGSSETRSVGVQPVLDTCMPTRLFTLLVANFSSQMGVSELWFSLV